jgi:hypothetical protein
MDTVRAMTGKMKLPAAIERFILLRGDMGDEWASTTPSARSVGSSISPKCR